MSTRDLTDVLPEEVKKKYNEWKKRMYKSFSEKTEENLQNLKQPVKWGEDPKCVCVRVCERERRETQTWLPQQLCHYVGGNYESDENGEGERIGAKALTLKRERNCQLDSNLHWQVLISVSVGRAGQVEIQRRKRG